MKPEYEKLRRKVAQWSRWQYKAKEYQVLAVTPGMLSQDSELDEWCPSVIYTAVQNPNKGETYTAGMELRFTRPITEFVRKFELVQ